MLTWRLLSRPDVYEANPLALAVLVRHGGGGLALFKGACTAVSLAAALGVWRCRPAAGVRLLAGVCLGMTLVVGYSLVLLLRPASSTNRGLPGIFAQGVTQDDRIDELHLFNTARLVVCQDLLEGRLSLAQGIEAMVRCLESHRSARRDERTAPPTDQPSQVAVYLFFHIARRTEDSPAHRARLAALWSEARARYPGIDSFALTWQPPEWTPEPGSRPVGSGARGYAASSP